MIENRWLIQFEHFHLFIIVNSVCELRGEAVPFPSRLRVHAFCSPIPCSPISQIPFASSACTTKAMTLSSSMAHSAALAYMQMTLLPSTYISLNQNFFPSSRASSARLPSDSAHDNFSSEFNEVIFNFALGDFLFAFYLLYYCSFRSSCARRCNNQRGALLTRSLSPSLALLLPISPPFTSKSQLLLRHSLCLALDFWLPQQKGFPRKTAMRQLPYN